MRVLFNTENQVVNLADGIDMDEYAALIGGTTVLMVSERPSNRHQALLDGTWEIPAETILAEDTVKENQWRTEQMPMALETVTAFQMGEEGIPGTEQQWKDYWLALRKWTADNPDFPDQNNRPKQPE